MGQDRVGLRRALSLGTEWPWISLTIPAQFSPIPSFGLAVNPRRGGQWQRLSKISHPWFRACPSTVTSWDIQANRSLCHTHTEPALKFPAHICPRSREATPAHPKHSLCANTRLEEESVEPLEPVYCPYCHSTDRGHSPLPASLPRRPTGLLGQRKLRPSCPQFSCWISKWPRTGRSCINPFSTSPTQPPGPWGGAGSSLLLPGRLSGRKGEQRDRSTPSSSSPGAMPIPGNRVFPKQQQWSCSPRTDPIPDRPGSALSPSRQCR